MRVSLALALALHVCAVVDEEREGARKRCERESARGTARCPPPSYIYISIARSHPRPILPLSLPYRSRLKSVLLAGQISTFCDEVDRVSGEGLCKLFLAGGLQKAERS